MAYYSSEAVEKFGRRLNWSPQYSLDQPRSNETAIAIVDNGMWRIASSDVKGIYDTYATGAFLTHEVYAVPNDKLLECADKGREKSVHHERQEVAMRRFKDRSGPTNG